MKPRLLSLLLPTTPLLLVGATFAQDLVADLVLNNPMASDAAATDVALEGSLAVLGVPGTDLSVIGGGTVSGVGSVAVFEPVGLAWSQTDELFAVGGETGDELGRSVDQSGGRVVAGAPGADLGGLFSPLNQAGKAYVFERDFLGNWFQAVELTASDPQAGASFGWSVAMDGNLVAVGAPQADGTGAVYVYQDSPIGWLELAKLSPPFGASTSFGRAVAVSDGRVLVGAPFQDLVGVGNSGAAYLFTNNAGTWSSTTLQAPQLIAGAEFGASVAMDGERLFIGSPREDLSTGVGYVFDPFLFAWNVERLVPSAATTFDSFGFDVALDGDRALLGSTHGVLDNVGAVLFTRSENGTWHQTCGLPAPDDFEFFGSSVSLDGDRMLVADPFSTIAGEFSAGRALLYADIAGTTLGCTALNPPGSLSVLGGTPSIDDAWELGVHNPLGTQGAGSFAFLAASAPPVGGCGVVIPGWGLGGDGLSGEFVVSLSPPVVLGPLPYDGGQATAFSLPIPNNPSLIGAELAVQGVISGGPGSTSTIGVTEGRRACIGVAID